VFELYLQGAKVSWTDSVKALWIDIDVGISEPGKKPKYPTLQEALKAAMQFREKYKLPAFSALVVSGSGLHVYLRVGPPLLP
jgi:hypothetical protein